MVGRDLDEFWGLSPAQTAFVLDATVEARGVKRAAVGDLLAAFGVTRPPSSP